MRGQLGPGDEGERDGRVRLVLAERNRKEAAVALGAVGEQAAAWDGRSPRSALATAVAPVADVICTAVTAVSATNAASIEG